MTPQGLGMLPPGVVLGEDGDVFQRATGFSFPSRVAGLPRIDVRLYDALGASLGVTYRAGEDGEPWVTVFTSPSLTWNDSTTDDSGRM